MFSIVRTKHTNRRESYWKHHSVNENLHYSERSGEGKRVRVIESLLSVEDVCAVCKDVVLNWRIHAQVRQTRATATFIKLRVGLQSKKAENGQVYR